MGGAPGVGVTGREAWPITGTPRSARASRAALPIPRLDPVTSAVIDELMVRMREKLGVTSIVITHDMRSAYHVGSKIAMLYEGKVRQVGTVDEIRNSADPIVRQFVEGRPELDDEPTRGP